MPCLLEEIGELAYARLRTLGNGSKCITQLGEMPR